MHHCILHAMILALLKQAFDAVQIVHDRCELMSHAMTAHTVSLTMKMDCHGVDALLGLTTTTKTTSATKKKRKKSEMEEQPQQPPPQQPQPEEYQWVMYQLRHRIHAMHRLIDKALQRCVGDKTYNQHTLSIFSHQYTLSIVNTPSRTTINTPN